MMMSGTKILTMENNMFNPTLVGFANNGNENDCFEILFNKLLENENQCDDEFDLLTELKSDKNDFNLSAKNEQIAYTLEDLMDFTGQVPDFGKQDGTFDLYGTDAQQPYSDLLLDTVLASPLSSSSEESCDINQLLFDCETSTELNPLEVKASPNAEHLLHELQQVDLSDVDVSNKIDVSQNVFSSLPVNASGDFKDLYALLLQQEPLTTDDEILQYEDSLSPSSSDDDVRYSPYKKCKKQKTPEQRLRKKAQNRNAASRYRNKKKDEFNLMNDEANELEEKNKELKGKVQGLRTEIDYLKNLMLDVIKARLANGTLPKKFLSALKADD